MNWKRIAAFVLVVLMVSVSMDVLAQCSMCQAVVESSQQGQEKSFGYGLNNAILYLMAIPYILLGGVGFMFYRKLRAKAE